MGDRSADGLLKNRTALSDVSNQLGKRKFVSVGSDSNTGSENQNNVGNEVGKSTFLRKDYTGKCVFEFGGKGVTSLLKAKQLSSSWNPFNRPNLLQKSGAFQIAGVSGETKEPLKSLNGNLPVARGDAAKKSPLESSVGLKDNYDKARSPLSVVIGGEGVEEIQSDITRNPSDCNTVSNICGSNSESMNAGDLTSNKSSSIRGSIPSSGSKECESEKCVAFDVSSNTTTTGVDFLKTCSCSFCLKAAYIWTDLQYQDTKGRISALKKSRKDVRSVIERSCSYGGFGKNVQGNSNKPTKLEHDLMSQWRSLFLHTEDVLIRENSQLQSSLQNLKDLRDHCKVDLETTNAASSKC
ncbi:Dna-directed rna polymerase subunit beta [Thalictrum thalictroides]|uniref:Dna-directed rna polymerase subunit beta n=1 Tax=Thalictrum thalictroides TaxID=46969 RepID=A0A7J6W295_THATH|nr:Dna-directed rna polymerase subunit beta [Thalictrum thalictroides]